MTLYQKWDVKNGFVFVLQFFSLISNCLGGVTQEKCSIYILCCELHDDEQTSVLGNIIAIFIHPQNLKLHNPTDTTKQQQKSHTLENCT